MDATWKDRSVLITGGSRGLGAALGSAFARRGARVALVARDREALERTAAKIRDEGGKAFAVPGDIARKEDIHAIAGAASALAGPVDVLIHNASALGPTPLRLLLDTECEDFGAVLEANLLGPFRLTKAIAGSMLVRGGGTVVHISSDAAVSAYARWGAYGVSKAALDHLNRIWAAEFEGTPVRFVAIDPGDMDTAMHAAAIPDAAPATLARPGDVAEKIVTLLAHAKSGVRLEASRAEVAQ